MFQSDIVHDDIVSATFGVYIRRATHTAQRPRMATWVLVYALRAVVSSGPPERRLVHRRRIYLDDRDTGRWHHFIFLAQVRRWIVNPQSNQGLFVQATDSRGEPLAVIQPNSDQEQPYVSDLCTDLYFTLEMGLIDNNPETAVVKMTCAQNGQSVRLCAARSSAQAVVSLINAWFSRTRS